MLISGGELVAMLGDHATALRAGDAGWAVMLRVRVKVVIVGGDGREQGSRLHLNYGHAFGHAIEQVRGPGPAGAGGRADRDLAG